MMKKQCPYCNKEMKKITSNHLKTHGVTYKEYLKRYNKEKYYERLILDFIEEYYQPSRKKFIEQVLFKETKAFDWITIETTIPTKYDLLKASATKKAVEESERLGKEVEIEMQKNLRRFPFCQQDLIAHIRHQRTIGIYTLRERSNCFCTFDIDMYNEEILQRIWNTLNLFGINDEYILSSYSGNKGCHLTIFFDEFVDKVVIQRFFDIIIYEANIGENKRANDAAIVELRGASGQGVKIPFGINRKNTVEYKDIRSYKDYEKVEKKGKGSYCYLINRYMGEIDTITKLESMQKVSKKTIEQIVADYETFEPEIKEEKVKELQVPQAEKDFTTLIEEIDISQLTNSKEDIVDSLENLLKRDIVSGKRHEVLFKIAIYNKSRGLTPDENENFLLEFSTQERHKYKAKVKENERDIHSLIKTIYFSKNCDKYRIKATTKEVFFSREDIEELLSVRNKSLRKVYFVLILHVKLYHTFNPKGENEQIQFFCGYERLQGALKIDCKTINNRLKMLQELGKINFIRKGEYEQRIFTKEEREEKSIAERKKEMRKLPNIYELNYKMQDVKEGYKLLCSAKKEEDNITYVNFQMMCAKVLTKKEIASYFKGAEAIDISKYKYQQTRAIG